MISPPVIPEETSFTNALTPEDIGKLQRHLKKCCNTTLSMVQNMATGNVQGAGFFYQYFFEFILEINKALNLSLSGELEDLDTLELKWQAALYYFFLEQQANQTHRVKLKEAVVRVKESLNVHGVYIKYLIALPEFQDAYTGLSEHVNFLALGSKLSSVVYYLLQTILPEVLDQENSEGLYDNSKRTYDTDTKIDIKALKEIYFLKFQTYIQPQLRISTNKRIQETLRSKPKSNQRILNIDRLKAINVEQYSLDQQDELINFVRETIIDQQQLHLAGKGLFGCRKMPKGVKAIQNTLTYEGVSKASTVNNNTGDRKAEKLTKLLNIFTAIWSRSSKRRNRVTTQAYQDVTNKFINVANSSNVS